MTETGGSLIQHSALYQRINNRVKLSLREVFISVDISVDISSENTDHIKYKIYQHRIKSLDELLLKITKIIMLERKTDQKNKKLGFFTFLPLTLALKRTYTPASKLKSTNTKKRNISTIHFHLSI